MELGAAGLRDGGGLKDIRAFIDGLYDRDLHAKRVDSLAAATLGVMTGASLAVAMIGQSLAQCVFRRSRPVIPERCRPLFRCDAAQDSDKLSPTLSLCAH